MSRIIKNIINSVLGFDKNQAILLHRNHPSDIEIIKYLYERFMVFEPHNYNKKLKVINDHELNTDMTIQPSYILVTNIHQIYNAHNLSVVLKIPVVLILVEFTTFFKKEQAFQHSPHTEQYINILFSPCLASNLYITNYHLVSSYTEIPNVLYERIKQWKPQ